MTRVYVPTGLDDLRGFVAAGLVPAGAERVVAEGDDEESEYAALMTAADLSAGAQPAGARRVVVVAEPPAGSPAAVEGDGELPWRTVVAVHADAEERAADADPDDDLAWFATQEVAALLG